MRVQILGSLNLDLVTQVQVLPRPGDTVLALASRKGAGGKGANQAKAAARYGADVAMHGAVGADEAGGLLIQGLRAEGIEAAGVVVEPGAATGQAQVLVAQDGENMIVVALGANRLARFTPPAAHDPSLFLAQLETPIAAAKAMFLSAGDGDLRVLNAAPAVLEGRTLFPLCDLIVLNRGELAVYAGVEAVSDTAIARLARGLLTRDDQHAVVTLGAQGSLIVGMQTAEPLAAAPAKAVDTTGAGDCFVGVLAAALAEGAALGPAGRIAGAAAALSVQTPGADSAPTRAVLDAALQGRTRP